MNTSEAIKQRRSIRKFKDTQLSDDQVKTLLQAAIQAPSGKNLQPWRFIVVKEDKRPAMIRIMRECIADRKARGEDIGSAEWTTTVMEHAPVTVFIYNPEGLHPWLMRPIDQMFWDVVNIQSIGAAIQNMCLAALELGLGSLWICDIFQAYEELGNWLGEEAQMIAAVSFGYPDENPDARPRKSVDEVTRWM